MPDHAERPDLDTEAPDDGGADEHTRDPDAPGVGAVGPDDDPGEVPEPNEPA